MGHFNHLLSKKADAPHMARQGAVKALLAFFATFCFAAAQEPQMVEVPAGSFTMGALSGETVAYPHERIRQSVEVAAFYMGKTEVTFHEWDACVADGGCTYSPDDYGWGRGDRPVIDVSYLDVTEQYIPWLNKKTGKTYRLPTEAEWEYAARAGSTASTLEYCAGNEWANFDGRQPAPGCPSGEFRGMTLPVGSLKANAFGLHDMLGNVWEWTQGCGDNARPQGVDAEKCLARVLRGGAWDSSGRSIRPSARGWLWVEHRKSHFNAGFRLARNAEVK